LGCEEVIDLLCHPECSEDPLANYATVEMAPSFPAGRQVQDDQVR
jgi:hypothetical protein